MKDRSEDPPHHERTLLPLSYISRPSGAVTTEYVTHAEGTYLLKLDITEAT